MFFCPFCGTLLLLNRTELSLRYDCCTCNYILPVRATLTRTTSFVTSNKKPSAATDELSDLESGAQVAATRCESGTDCPGDKAFYVQVQIRSADEPPTTFYKCATCAYRWRMD